MVSKSKSKQSQKQEQTVKVVINQNANKNKKNRSRKRQSQTNASQKQVGPTPYGYTPQQGMRTAQTFTPQISNNSVADVNGVINALRTSLLGQSMLGQSILGQSILGQNNTRDSIGVRRQSNIPVFDSPRTVYGTRLTPNKKKVDAVQQTQSDEYIDLTQPVLRNQEYKPPQPVRFSEPLETDIMPSFQTQKQDDEASLLGENFNDVSVVPETPQTKNTMSEIAPITPMSARSIRSYQLPKLLRKTPKEGSYVLEDIVSGKGFSSDLVRRQTVEEPQQTGSDMVAYTGFPVVPTQYNIGSSAQVLRDALVGQQPEIESEIQPEKQPEIQPDYRLTSSFVVQDDQVNQLTNPLQDAGKQDDSEPTKARPSASHIPVKKNGEPDLRFAINKINKDNTGRTLNIQ